MQQVKIIGAAALFAGTLIVVWVTHGTGIVRNDPARNISIPDQLTVPFQVQAAYNDTTMFFRYRWPAARPGILHDVLRYEDGKWITEGAGVPGSDPNGMHEDRVAMMLDDGSVPEFSRYGGYITIGAGLEGLTDEAPEVVTKYLPATRNQLGQWDDMAPDGTLATLRDAGYFLDLWHWRGGRSNPVGQADDQNISTGRDGDAGSASYSTNFDNALGQPRVMFDPATAGYKALNWDDVVAGRVSQDQVYALIDGQVLPYDPDAGWKNGDVLPRRILKPGTGSRGDIGVLGQGRWADGFWDITLTRALDTGNPADDKILRDLGSYTTAFAIHRNATGLRWHYVSLPQTLGLGREAEITATRFAGDTPTWGNTWTEITLYYPGQVTWPMLNSTSHAGAEYIAKGVPVKYRHSPEQLTQYGIEVEFKSEIRPQWLKTLFAGLALIAAFGVSLNLVLAQRKEV
ncbi:MAG: hypothetical protein K0B00_06770 [Rhodobacteraceae bacterium]|nr:hypothetical protein [Paracoccaceae bacterium]